MDLSQLQIKARQRSPWEAVDLGFVVARNWYKPLFVVWVIPPFVLFFILNVAFWDTPWIASVVVWWLKPLFDRLPLHIASRRLFGGDVTVSATLKGMLGIFREQWFASLTWRRFSPSRSHDLAITCLEKLNGEQRRRRISVMHITSGSPAMWLTILCYHLEIAIACAIFVAFLLFVPENTDVQILPWIAEGSLWFQRIFNFLYLIAAALIAPFYCMSGFMLYISRRIDLEAWDLEIRFRNLVQTKHQSSNSSFAAILLAPLFVAAMMVGSEPAAAQDAQQDQVYSFEVGYLGVEESGQLIEDVLAGEDFSNTREYRRLTFKESEERDPDAEPSWWERFLDWWDSLWDADTPQERRDSGFWDFLAGLSAVVKVLLIVVAATAAAYIVYLISQQAQKTGFFSRSRPSSREKPEVLFGLDVSEESVPENVPEQVRERILNGDLRGALALLFGSFLAKLMHERSFRFYSGHTENECAQIVSRSADKHLTNYTFELTAVWVQMAYAGQVPQAQKVEALCAGWEDVFSE